MVTALVPLLVVGAVTEGSPWSQRWTPAALGCLVYLAVVGSVIAFSVYYWLVRHADVTKVMSIALVTPVFAVALGWWMLGETLSWRTLLGSLAVVAGAGLMMRPAPPVTTVPAAEAEPQALPATR